MGAATVLAQADELRQHRMFRQARELLAEQAARVDLDDVQRRKVHQKWAMAYYHDGEMARAAALDKALEILDQGCDLDDADDPEHLSIAGAIYKRRFEVTCDLADLSRALSFYRRATEAASDGDWFSDQCYAAVNEAFVSQRMAGELRARGLAGHEDHARRASTLRLRIVEQLRPGVEPGGTEEANWWVVATYAEALLGQGEPGKARKAVEGFDLGLLAALGDWQRESTARQLASTAELAGLADDADVGDTLRHIAGCAAASYPASLRLNLGLALSGGGFRASFFHVGVLARLAEVDLLRHVAVLSCVSGGAILGTAYYLALQRLLEERRDEDVDRDAYVEVVRQVQDAMLAAVETDIRTRAFFGAANPWRRAASRARKLPFSRTIRMGELVEQQLYQRVAPAPAPRTLGDLLVRPVGEASFNPKLHNWRRAAKVPVLLLNATTLNTGHPWQSAATWIGEPDSPHYGDIDDIAHVPRLYLDHEVAGRYREFPLAWAVAASACVPGLFPPIILRGVEQARPQLVVGLVDGGVHDNQGLGGLLDQDCTHVFLSDASGQMAELPRSPSIGIRVLPRTLSIQSSTIRTGVFTGLERLVANSRVRQRWTLHLTKDVPATRRSSRGEPDATTSYGMPLRAQTVLATLRTDLDRFRRDEACALMLSGYRMASHALAADPPVVGLDERRESWAFDEVAGALDDPGCDQYLELVSHLARGRHRFFRRFRRLRPPPG